MSKEELSKQEKENKESLTKKSEPKTEKPSWLTMKSADVEKLILDLHRQGVTPAKIGIILRDQHGIPKAKLLGKKIRKIIESSGAQFPAEITDVRAKIMNLERHNTQHKHDHTARRSLAKKLWIVTKLSKQAP
jgi:small subunit ribosomal protein S15